MNELIYKLTKQALDQAVPRTWITLTGQDLAKFAEKFADLMVQECITACKAQSIYDPIVLPYKPSQQFASAIEQHFMAKE